MTERIEPEWAMVTVMFVDIRGFTTFADQTTAREAVEYLNEFFAVAVPVVTRHGGSVNKLLGDGLLAAFADADHAASAVACAGDLLATVEHELGERWRIGIGVNSGLVLTGTVGTADFHEHGLIGDPVNVASRVQDATRTLREPLLFTEATRCLLEDPAAAGEPRGELRLKGKAEPVAVYAPGRVRT